MEYTKGKWEARCMGSEGWCIYAKNGKRASEVTREEFLRNCSPIATLHGSMEEQKANALLFAASPRMAELLERLVNEGWSASISEEAEEILQNTDK